MVRILPLLVLGLSLSAQPQPPPAGKAPEHSPQELEIFDLTNKVRKEHNLPALQLNPALSKIARAHAENMARQGKMEHDLDGKTPFDRIKAAGYKYAVAGENIAVAEKGAKLGKIVTLWMDSKGHRENILSPDFTEIGIGIVRAKNGDSYVTQDFAKPR